MKHGSASSYRNGCRCDDCRQAQAAQQLTDNLRRQQRLASTEVEHGRHSTYVNWMCRCTPCREANRLACREYRRKRKAAA